MEWFRWYSGTVSDPKWQLVAADSGQPVGFVLAVWAHVLERANAGNGTMDGWNPRVVAVSIGTTTDAVNSIVAAMQGLVLDGETVCKWSERQPKRRDDDSRDRVRAHRERKRSDVDETHDVTHVTHVVTHGNAAKRAETLEESRVDKSREEHADDTRARARDATPDEVGKQVLTILGVLNDPTWYGNWGRVHQWIADGASPENDIYPTIKRVMAKRGAAGPPGNLKYFDQAVADAIKARTEKLPEGRITQNAQTGHLSTEERAARILERLERERPRRVGGSDRANGGDVVPPAGSG